MDRRNWIVGAAFIVLCMTVSFVSARTISNETKACFVVLDSPSVLMHQRQLSGGALLKTQSFKTKRSQAEQYAQALAVQHNALVQKLSEIDSNAKVLHQFSRLVNALAVEIDPSQWNAIRSLPGVAYVAPVRKVRPFMTKSVDLMNLSQAWEKVGTGNDAGEGVFVAVVDTGVDITHPAFDAEGYSYPEGFPKGEAKYTNGKIIAARVFPPSSGNKGDVTPFDRYGHGTNVATIIGANRGVSSPLGVLSGVAPKVQLGNYKIFTNDSSDDAQVIQAIESAVEDGADVLNLSFGMGLFSDPQHDLQILAVKNAVALGAVVVIAAGNDGAEDYTVGSPGQTEEAITVGSITNSHVSKGDPDAFGVTVSAYADGAPIVENVPGVVSTGGSSFTNPIIGRFPIQDADLLDGGDYGGITNGLGCTVLNLDQPLMGWLLVSRGTCTFSSKLDNAQQAGAKGVVFIDSKSNVTTLDWPTATGTTLPGILIGQASGLLIKDALKDGSNVVVKIDGGAITDGAQTPNRLSTFSSVGPTINYAMKPDVLAIGEGSFAGTQNDDTTEDSFNASGYQWLSGTSMSAPRVAGLAAILRHQHPGWPPAWIKSAISLSTQKTVLKKTGKSTSVLERGAGIVDASAAVGVDTIADPVLLNFGMHMIRDTTKIAQWVTVVNVASAPCLYTLQPANVANPHGIVLSEGQFVLQPGEKKEIQVLLPSLDGLTGGDNEGNLTLTNATTNRSYTLTYWARLESAQPPTGDALLIDDDGGRAYEEYYTSRLQEIGVSYTYWQARNVGYPSLDYLSHFKNVIWFMSDNTLNSIMDKSSSEYRRIYNPRMLFQQELMKYLVGGGSLFLSAQDYSDDQEKSAFSQEVLTVAMDDKENGASTVQGVSGNPVSEGVGPFTLTFPRDFENWTDYLTILDPNRTEPAFVADGSRAKTIGVTIDSCSYRAVFLAFPLEMLDASAGAMILRKSLEWMNGVSASSNPALAAVEPNSLNKAENSGPYSIQIDGKGFTLKTGYRASLDYVPLTDCAWKDCNTLTGIVPAGIEPGTYTLRLVTGDGRELRLENALTIVDDSGTDVREWSLY